MRPEPARGSPESAALHWDRFRTQRHHPIPILDLASEVDALWDEPEPAVERELRSGRVVVGPDVEAFASEVAALVGVRHVVRLNSDSVVLLSALEALNVGPGGEVITTPFIWKDAALPWVIHARPPGFGRSAGREAPWPMLLFN